MSGLDLYLSQKTLALLPEIRTILNRWGDCLTADVSEEERLILERVLERMKDRASDWMANR